MLLKAGLEVPVKKRIGSSLEPIQKDKVDSSLIHGIKNFFFNNESKKSKKSAENKKDFVDPYVEFAFAGKKIQSRICYNDSKPAWNQQLKITYKFPSMCDKLRIAIKDWDRTSEDDFIATIDLPITLISDLQADGFLPTFGPCFLNVYGSPREYTDIATCLDELDVGKGEGVAYRGRILLDVQTNLNEKPGEVSSEIKNSDIQRLGTMMHRSRFKLFSTFYEATMLSDVLESPIEFEVSIGNYGNALDENAMMGMASTTQSCNPVFDGCSYNFLPWTEQKPCIQILSYWEDISFRYESMNQIRKLKTYVVNSMREIQERVALINDETNVNTTEMTEMAILIMSIIEEIQAKASVSLPDPVTSCKTQSNDLDKNRYIMRCKQMKTIVKKCQKMPNLEFKLVLEELETIVATLEKIEKEPQNSIPDIIIWMLCDSQRVAYYRIPAHQVFYSPNAEYQGEFCSVIQTIALKWPGRLHDIRPTRFVMSSQVRLKLWFGLEKYENNWLESHVNDENKGALLIYAETFENQMFQWTSQRWNYDGLKRPRFSDLSGKIELNKDSFKLPTEWEWRGDWEIVPDISSKFDRNFGKNNFMEEVYEQSFRYFPGAPWNEGFKDRKPYLWINLKFEKTCDDLNEIELPENWKWDDEWSIDVHRAVDPEGWEYCLEPSMGGWTTSEKVYQLYRRRRWIRNRSILKKPTENPTETNTVDFIGQGWEYSTFFSTKFHSKEHSSDGVRRRRWRRPMQPNCQDSYLSAVCVIENKENNNSKKDIPQLNAPRVVIQYKRVNKYQLRAHIYQARSLMSLDTSTSASDPYCQVAFVNHSMRTEVKAKTISPIWDQTLIFESVDIYGDPEEILQSPPVINIELFDHDNSGEADFMGRLSVKPILITQRSDSSKLKWYKIMRDKSSAGELLALFELYSIDSSTSLPPYPPNFGSIYRLPTEIRPKLQRTIIEVLIWGVRNMKKFQLSDINCPQVIFECGEHKIESEIIRNVKRCPNFQKPVLYFDVMIPTEEPYVPPLTIKIVDHRNFGRKPIVGMHVIKSLANYRVDRDRENFCVFNLETMRASASVITIENDSDSSKSIPDDPKLKKKHRFKNVFKRNNKLRSSKYKRVHEVFGNKVLEEEVIEDDIDWWCKFYASLGHKDKCGSYLKKGYDKLMIYDQELENLKKFENFTDFCQTFKMLRGKTSVENEAANKFVSEIKASFKMYPILENSYQVEKNLIYKNVQPMNREECLLRVYIVRGIDLQAKDSNGKSDAYIEIECGKLKVDNRKKYVPNSNSPEFGYMFELRITLPLDKDLCIRLKDYDLITTDEVIGETWIDIENRVLSKHRATCGLPEQYNESGINAWRDSRKPSQILSELCQFRGINCIIPKADETVLKLDNKILSLDQFGAPNERLCLHVLKEFGLVREHIETRKLYNPIQPGLEQGKLQMWLDIFPKSLGAPASEFDITPRKAKKHVLRCVVWNTTDVICDDVSITGELMSDIYLKGWLQGLETDKQSTDIHYRSMDGDGNFNWRFTYDFDYLPAEQNICVRKKEHFWSLDETIVKLPPVLTLQIWDNDKFTADDFLGQLSLDLNKMIKPVKTHEECGLHQLPDKDPKKAELKYISLFKQKRLKGWLPCIMELSDNKQGIAGKVELEFEILTEEEALAKPAGRGREEPNQNPRLEPPDRPETSFMWFSSPFKTFKHILWKKYKWPLITMLFLILIFLFALLMLYSLPGALWGAILT